MLVLPGRIKIVSPLLTRTFWFPKAKTSVSVSALNAKGDLHLVMWLRSPCCVLQRYVEEDEARTSPRLPSSSDSPSQRRCGGS